MDLINLKDINVKFKTGVHALKDVDLNIKKGEFVFIIGGSGSGKSTLIKTLYREVKVSSGVVNIRGLDISKLRDSKVYKIRRKLGIVFQDYRLLDKNTVYENVAFALEVINEEPSEIQKKVLRALDLVGLKSKTRVYPNELSGGEQQRVAIARAIVNEPKILLCDEPTGNLDPEMSFEIVKILDYINKTTGTTIIMATHDRDIVNALRKRVIVIKEGVIHKDYEKGKYNDKDI